MYSKAKYHLYESAHSGLLPDQPVNLLPKTWTTRTITDGFWMTDNTLSALNWRDYFLANMIDTVDEDKRNHYIAGNGIAINHEERTISFVPNENNYEFDENSGMFFESQNELVYTKLNSSTDNKIQIVNGYIDYKLTKATSSIGKDPYEHIEETKGIIDGEGKITSFPANANVVYVTNDTFQTNNNYSDSGEWFDYGHCEVWTAAKSEWRTATKSAWGPSTGVATATATTDLTGYSADVFDPTNSAKYNGGYAGGSNYITDNVNMVPSGVLFIY